MPTKLHYTLTPLPHRHIFQVHLQITTSNESETTGLTLQLPNWIAGSYMIRDFARHIVRIHATDEQGQAVALTPLDQHTWQSAPFVGALTVTYEVFAHDTSVRTAFLDGDGGFFNATSVCLLVQGLEMVAHHLTLNAPEGNTSWQVATTLPRMDGCTSHDFGHFMAANYDELADHPVRFGELTWLSFHAHGVLHEVALAGHLPYLDVARLTTDVQRMCEAQLALFEPEQPARAPFKRYVFMVDVRASGYGGLEHRDSTALLCERADLPMLAQSEQPRSEAYIVFLGLCSHEYFHAWNVKRIKPSSFVYYDLSNIIDTSLLWFFEGVTSYYDDLIMYRTGLLDETQYLKKLENCYNAVVRHDGVNVQTAHDSGWYAWTKYYQVSPNTPNAVVSYYSKGALIALSIDLFIREHSAGRFSLDDVMRDLWAWFGRDFYALYPQGLARGVTEADIVASVSHFAGVDARDFLNQMLHTTEALPLREALGKFGVTLSDPKNSVAQLGATSKKVDAGWQIQRVLNDSAAQKAGLAPDDVLLTFDRIRLNAAPDDVLARIDIGAQVTVHFLRDDVLHDTTLINSPAPHGVYALSLSEGHTQVFNKTP